MLKIAITGNIASGKTIVEKLIEAEGFNVYDTDKIAHEILEKSSEVKKVFGTTNRTEIAKIVFSDSNMLKKLEEIIHPKVKKELEKIFNSTEKIVFVSVPQLFEAGFDSMFDKIIFISARENLRLKRLMNRNNLTKEEALKRIRAQEKEDDKIKKSDYIIENNGDIDSLTLKLKELINIYWKA